MYQKYFYVCIGFLVGICVAYLFSWLVFSWSYSEAVANIFVAIGTISLAVIAVWKDIFPEPFLLRSQKAEAMAQLKKQEKALSLSICTLNIMLEHFLEEAVSESIRVQKNDEYSNLQKKNDEDHLVRTCMDFFDESSPFGTHHIQKFREHYGYYSDALFGAKTLNIKCSFKDDFSSSYILIERLSKAKRATTITEIFPRLQKIAKRLEIKSQNI